MAVWDKEDAGRRGATKELTVEAPKPLAIAVGDVVVVHDDPFVVRRPRLRLSPSSVGALAAATAGAVLGLRPLQDNSFLTHLATGRLILDRMAVPSADPYSFTAAGHDWVVQSWLPSLFYALAERIGGDAGLMLLRGVVTTVLALLVWRLTRSAPALAARLVTLVLVVSSCAKLWSPRPLLIGLVLFAAALVVTEEDRWPAWTLVPIGWVWVNSHGTFPLLLAYLCVRLVGRRLDGRPVERQARLLGCAAAGIAVGAIGPVGLKGLTFPLHLLSRSDALKAVLEWQSPSFSDLPNLIFLGLAVCALVLPRQRRWEDLLPSAAFLVLATTGLRHIPWAALVLVPAAARALPFQASSARVQAKRPLDGVVAACLVITCAVVGAVQLQRDAYDFQTYPVAELAWMADNGIDTRTARVMLPDYVGNYLEWRDSEQANVFFDDRFDMYPLHVIEAHRVLFAGERGWDEALDRYGIEAVVWPKKLALAELLDADARWDVVHESSGWVVAVRR